MEIKPGYVYHIDDSYFDKVDDPNLMHNKENGNKRPTYCCILDSKTSLLWMVPMSTKAEKYQQIANRSIERYGESLGIVMGKFDGKESAFLLQNTFPVIPKYISHVHSRNGNPIPVSHNTMKEIEHNFSKIMGLLKKGKKVVFTDVKKIEKIMIDEHHQEQIAEAKKIDKVKQELPSLINANKKFESILHQNPDLLKLYQQVETQYFVVNSNLSRAKEIDVSAPILDQYEAAKALRKERNAIVCSNSSLKTAYTEAKNDYENNKLATTSPKETKSFSKNLDDFAKRIRAENAARSQQQDKPIIKQSDQKPKH